MERHQSENLLADKLAVLHQKFRKDNLFRIGVIDAHFRHRLDGVDETA